MKTLVMVVLLLASTSAKCEVRYNITAVGGQYAMDVNENRQVIGLFYNPATDEHRAFLWQNGNAIMLGGLGDVSDSAISINNAGLIVGSSIPFSKTDYNSTLWSHGAIIDLSPESTISSAEEVNDNGEIAGWEDWYTGYFISKGRKTIILNFNAFCLNNFGLVAGRTFGNDGERAAIWTQTSGLQDIDPPASLWGMSPLPTNQSRVMSVNDLGQIFGVKYLLDADNNYVQRTWMLDHGIYTDIGNIGYPHANNYGQVVGGSYIWENGITTDLNTVVPLNSGWSELRVNNINNNGDIVGWGMLNGQQTGFLMTSVPEPSSLLALAGGVVWILSFRRRR